MSPSHLTAPSHPMCPHPICTAPSRPTSPSHPISPRPTPQPPHLALSHPLTPGQGCGLRPHICSPFGSVWLPLGRPPTCTEPGAASGALPSLPCCPSSPHTGSAPGPTLTHPPPPPYPFQDLILKRAADIAEALYSVPRGPAQLSSLGTAHGPAAMVGVNSFGTQLAVSIGDAAQGPEQGGRGGGGGHRGVGGRRGLESTGG